MKFSLEIDAGEIMQMFSSARSESQEVEARIKPPGLSLADLLKDFLASRDTHG